jgi:hypothetical protein
MKQADLMDMFKRPPRVPSTIVVFLDPLSPAASTSSAIKTPANTEENPNDLEPTDAGDIQMEYPSD